MSNDDITSSGKGQNGWNEYSKLVLKELETLADGIEGLRAELHSVKNEIAKMQVREDKVDELREWKKRMDEVATPNQIKSSLRSIESLQTFRTKAITVFAVVQFLMAAFGLVIKFIV